MIQPGLDVHSTPHVMMARAPSPTIDDNTSRLVVTTANPCQQTTNGNQENNEHFSTKRKHGTETKRKRHAKEQKKRHVTNGDPGWPWEGCRSWRPPSTVRAQVLRMRPPARIEMAALGWQHLAFIVV